MLMKFQSYRNLFKPALLHPVSFICSMWWQLASELHKHNVVISKMMSFLKDQCENYPFTSCPWPNHADHFSVGMESTSQQGAVCSFCCWSSPYPRWNFGRILSVANSYASSAASWIDDWFRQMSSTLHIEGQVWLRYYSIPRERWMHWFSSYCSFQWSPFLFFDLQEPEILTFLVCLLWLDVQLDQSSMVYLKRRKNHKQYTRGKLRLELQMGIPSLGYPSFVFA